MKIFPTANEVQLYTAFLLPFRRPDITEILLNCHLSICNMSCVESIPEADILSTELLSMIAVHYNVFDLHVYFKMFYKYNFNSSLFLK